MSLPQQVCHTLRGLDRCDHHSDHIRRYEQAASEIHAMSGHQNGFYFIELCLVTNIEFIYPYRCAGIAVTRHRIYTVTHCVLLIG